MARAFITVETATGKSSPLLDEVTTTPGVEEAHVVAGQYDIIAEATGQEVYDLIHSVATSVRDLEGVVDTRTYICLE
jgi:DNA-binding Lrp family transcriptional regulator